MALIVSVERGSVGEELGIKPGCELVGFNGMPLEDILDYIYFDAETEFLMTVKTKKGKLIDFEIEKEPYERLGLWFGEEMEITPRRCKNKCAFCFVDQLPKGMRDTLYVKDDDYRLSFISGNYITLTNVTDEEIERIIRLRLSPIYVSVHCFDSEIKRRLIANKNSDNLYQRLKRLSENNITVHTQIVLVKGMNDGAVLKDTLMKLASLRPDLASVAVVPVGLTRHREGLPCLEPFDKKDACKVIDFVEEFNRPFEKDGGFVWCSDEFYIKAERELPAGEYYGSFPQIENGVGLVEDFLLSFEEQLANSQGSENKLNATCVTGVSFAGILKKLLPGIKSKFPNADLGINAVINEFFGETVTVAGLITGGDIIKQLSAAEHAENLIIPINMLREFTDTFLDGVTVSELEAELKVKVYISKNGGSLVSILEELAK